MTESAGGGTGRMAPEQHLYSDAIYRINSAVELIIDEHSEFFSNYGIQLWPTQLDSFSGEFRWLLLRDEDWRFNENLLNAIARLPEVFWNSWDSEKGGTRGDDSGRWETLSKSWPELVDKKNPDFGDIDGTPLTVLWNTVIARCGEGEETKHPRLEELTSQKEEQQSHHHAFLKLIEGRSFPKREYHDGIVLEEIMKGAKESPPVFLDRIHSTRSEEQEKDITRYENVSCHYYDTERKRSLGTLEKPSAESAKAGWQVALQGAIARAFNVEHMISIPIYDGAQAGPCYGRLVGIIHGAILREIENSEEDRDSIGEKIAERVRRHNDKLAASFRAADMARIARADVTQRDLDADARGLSPALRHFLHVLPMAQDWKRVRIEQRRKDGSWKPFQYWGRTGRGWVKVNAYSPVINGLLGVKSKRFMESDLSLLDMIQGAAPRLEESERRALDAWRLSFEYPDYALLPEDKEVLERQYWHEQIDIWSIVLPKVLLKRENVRREREALRRAVSGIMGRNMSHNIGSHVLARYASKIRDDGVADRNKDVQRSDLLQYLQRRMDFLADVATSDMAFWFQSLSLKEQMGCLNWDEQIARLNRKDNEDESGQARNSKEPVKSVLLRFITGKEDLKATVDYDSKDDVYFACPGGEVGVHALFVILENIIRNSARHGSPTDDTDKAVELEVQLCKENQSNDLLKMKIVDPRSSVEQNHEVTLTLAASVKDKTGVKVGYTKPTGSEAKPIRDRKGVPVESFCFPLNGGANARCADDSAVPVPVKVAVTDDNSLVLTFDKALDPDSTPAKEAFCVTAGDDSVAVSMVAIERRLDDRINDIMKEPILTSDGEAKAENWGIREMQICAHYLRGFSLFDLESPPDEGCAVLKAGCHDGKAGCHDGKLKYTIYLKRAQRMAVVRKPEPKTNPPDEKQLERQGVKIIETTSPDWCAIGAEVGSYEYLVVEKQKGDESDSFGLPDSPRNAKLASLSVRRLRLSPEEITKRIADAGGGGSEWLEFLHKRWAEEIRDRRTAWRDKPLYGVSLSTNEALQPRPCPEWPNEVGCDGLILAAKKGNVLAAKNGNEANTFQPLPADAEQWLQELSCNTVSAAWVDHGTKDDFEFGSSAGLGQSGGRNTRRNTNGDALNLGPPPLWISAETAGSGDPHARFLNERARGNEWEILAAAVPRIAVLDERVQSAGSQGSSTDKELTLYDLWNYMGVWTPRKCESDLDRPDFDKCKKYLQKPADRCDQYPIDILVIHLTILERLAKDRNATLRNTLDCLVCGTHASDAEIVIVTGRGVPAVARAAGRDDGSGLAGVRYLPISALLESLVSRPSKLGLMRTLWSAGAPA